MKVIRPIALAICLLGACAGDPVSKGTSKATSETSPPTGLSPQVLENGDCGLFLWNKTDAKTFVFFQRSGESSALFFDKQELAASNTANGGELFGQYFTQSVWLLSDGRRLSLSVEPGEEISGGQRIPAGVITLISAEGWKTKTPVAGVWACQEE